MTDEKLNILKQIVENYYTEFDIGMNTYVTTVIGKELLSIITAEQERRTKIKEPCEWCERCLTHNKNVIENNTVMLSKYESNGITVQADYIVFNFCPNCGRELKGERK